MKMLRTWHKLLMANAQTINEGEWRKGKEPMQIISGSYGREMVHYEAPPSKDVPGLMKQFVDWFNGAMFPLKGDVAEAVLKSAVAHLYISHDSIEGKSQCFYSFAPTLFFKFTTQLKKMLYGRIYK